MSAPTLEILSLSSLVIAYIAAVSGSLHCIGMCGPLRLLSQSPWAGTQYQSGRLLAYLILGFSAGSLGAALPGWVLFSLLAIGFLLSFLEGKMPPALQQYRQKILLLASAKPWLMGLASGILPCGLLHGWLAVAAATANPYRGALVLFILWLGTVPALEASSRLLRYPMQRLRQRFPRALPILLILIALIPLGMRLGWASPASMGKKQAHCHFMK